MLNSKIARLQANCQNIDGSARHYQGWHYVTLEQLNDIMRGLFDSAGIAFFVEVPEIKTTYLDGKIHTHVMCRFTLVDTEDQEQRELYWHGEALKDDDTGVSGAITSAVRSFFQKQFLIGTLNEQQPARRNSNAQPKTRPATPQGGIDWTMVKARAKELGIQYEVARQAIAEGVDLNSATTAEALNILESINA